MVISFGYTDQTCTQHWHRFDIEGVQSTKCFGGTGVGEERWTWSRAPIWKVNWLLSMMRGLVSPKTGFAHSKVARLGRPVCQTVIMRITVPLCSWILQLVVYYVWCIATRVFPRRATSRCSALSPVSVVVLKVDQFLTHSMHPTVLVTKLGNFMPAS